MLCWVDDEKKVKSRAEWKTTEKKETKFEHKTLIPNGKSSNETWKSFICSFLKIDYDSEAIPHSQKRRLSQLRLTSSSDFVCRLPVGLSHTRP